MSGAWVDAHLAGAPDAVRDQVTRYVAGRPGLPEAALSEAGLAALRATLAAPGDRSVALDLLAADALVTLALQARAEREPAGLAAFARRLREAGASAL